MPETQMQPNRDRELVSVVTPAYNSASFILGTIESVRSQSYSHWEMIIVDDRSQDDTYEIVEREAQLDSRIRLIRLDQNSGTAIARNIAMDAARGRYVAFLDSDDLWLPEKLEKQLEFMREKNSAFSFTSYRKINESGEEIGDPVAVPEWVDYRKLLKNTAIGCLTVMLDREKTGHLSMGTMRSRQDYVLWFALLKRGLIAHGIQSDLARYRIVSNSISRNKFKAARTVWKLYREVEELSLPYSLWCFSNYALRAYVKGRR